ncbi:hypothetical protein D5086_012929 [Populus alba]|uniref:Uncharacterized protein n=1 Tax=Populus alba TaxID=43335 RepID=A0ACC4C4U2_POPAL
MIQPEFLADIRCTGFFTGDHVAPLNALFHYEFLPSELDVLGHFQAGLSGTAVSNSFNKVSSTGSKATIIYKPQAKLVSKATVSLLANMGNFNTNSQQMLQPVETRPRLSKQDKHNFSSQLTSNLHQNIPSPAEADHTTEPLRLTSLNQEEDPKTLSHASNGDRPSYDGYNWRKYGQKQVKGSEYPRSYYKCTYPNCPVKKKVERSFDGQIAEIVYKGEHNHSKPQPPKRNSSGTQGLSDGNAPDRNSIPLWSNQLNERNEGSEGREENQNEIGLPVHSIYQGKAPPSYDPAGTGTINAGTGTSENSCGVSGECDDGSKGLEGANDEPKSKRRKTEIQSTEGGMSGEGVQEPRVVVQSSTDSEILGDGFRWRKYGQKIVKGNPYPRLRPNDLFEMYIASSSSSLILIWPSKTSGRRTFLVVFIIFDQSHTYLH